MKESSYFKVTETLAPGHGRVGAKDGMELIDGARVGPDDGAKDGCTLVEGWLDGKEVEGSSDGASEGDSDGWRLVEGTEEGTEEVEGAKLTEGLAVRHSPSRDHVKL